MDGRESPPTAARPSGAAAFVPFQLSDAMYASIFRDPEGLGYPVLPAGAVDDPKYGYIYVEERTDNKERPKCKDGLGWIGAGTSVSLLRDGQTEIVRRCFTRRNKSDLAQALVKP